MILPIYKHEEISARATTNGINEKYSKKYLVVIFIFAIFAALK